jgi:predicted dehydrogenase
MPSSRRSFFRGALTAAPAAFSIVPRHVLGGSGYVAPSDQMTLGCVGVGSQGMRVMMDFLAQPDVRVTAVCDCNRGSSDYSEWGEGELRNKARKLLQDPEWGKGETGATCGMEPCRVLVDAYYARNKKSGAPASCAAYTDFRELLAKEKGIDSIIIGTPDHLHAPVAVASMKAGKNVMSQKPMAHSLYATWRMADVARETKVATQVTINNQASEATRLLCEWIWAGAIGPVQRVINWSSRPFWPQGMERPQTDEPVPPYLDWNLWLGPAAYRPYNKAYQPFIWRGWYDFGCGALGDMGCYSFDTIFRVLKLTAPTGVEATSTKLYRESFPAASIIHFAFPARESMPPVKLTWYDGGLKPERPAELAAGEKLAAEGLLFIGDRGTILCGFDGANPRLIPDSAMQAFQQPPKTLPRSPGNDREWIDACKGGPAGNADFPFSARITETLMLGNIAMRTGEKLTWDAAARKFTNSAAANALLNPPLREGWAF